MKNSINLQKVCKSFGEKKILNEVSMQVAEGEIFGLLGPSGAGKTTLIKILTGQLSYEGISEILEQSCNRLNRTIYSDIGMMLDNSGTYDRMSCYDNMLLFAKLYGVNKAIIHQVLEKVGLSDSKSPAGKLSKGMKQRLVLARAIMHHPKILFLDEPTSGLDPTTAEEIHKLLLELKKEGSTIFLTTHNMEEAYQLCDHIALLNEGCIVEYGVPEEICRKYNTLNNVTILSKDGKRITLTNQPDSAEEIATYFLQDNVEAIHSSEPTLGTVFMTLTGKELNV